MPIRFTSQNIDFELPQTEKVKKWITQVVLQRGKRVGNISYLFCDDEYLLGVNQRFLNHDTYTDIITFDYVVADLISGRHLHCGMQCFPWNKYAKYHVL